MESLTSLVYGTTAIAVGVAVHSIAEPSNIRNRVRELDARLRGDAYEAPPGLPFAIDTSWKALAVGMAFTLVVAAVAFAVLWLISPSVTVCLMLTSAVLLAKEGINTVSVNSYHEEITAVIDQLERPDADVGVDRR